MRRRPLSWFAVFTAVLTLAPGQGISANAVGHIYRLWIMSRDGSGKQVLFECIQSKFARPRPTPDGTMIADVVYTEDTKGAGVRVESDPQASAIALLDANGTNFRILPTASGFSSCPMRGGWFLISLPLTSTGRIASG